MLHQWTWKAIVRRLRPAGPLEEVLQDRRQPQSLGSAFDVRLRRTGGCSCLVCAHHRGSGRQSVAAGRAAEQPGALA
jgi:hypothetical protein